MELEGSSVMVVIEEDENTGAKRRVRWTLESLYETNMSQVFLARNEQGDPKIVKRIMCSKMSKNELGVALRLNAVRADLF